MLFVDSGCGRQEHKLHAFRTKQIRSASSLQVIILIAMFFLRSSGDEEHIAFKSGDMKELLLSSP
jgi:hypothetical protein